MTATAPVVLLSLVRCHPAVTSDFPDLWRQAARGLATSPGLSLYVHHHVRPEHVPMPIERGDFEINGLAQMRFTSANALASMLASPRYAEYLQALSASASHCLNLITHLHVAIAPQLNRPDSSAFLKRMSLLQRIAGVDRESFQTWWKTVHGPKVAQQGGLHGSLQHHVIESRLVIGKADHGFDQVPDGVTELLLPGVESMFQTFAPTGTPITNHAATMIGKITPMLMQDEAISRRRGD